MHKAVVRVLDWLGWPFIEIAFRVDSPLAYRIGNWLYGVSFEYGLAHGVFIENPAYPGDDEPKYIFR